MEDAKKTVAAKAVFKTLCNAIEAREWTYKKYEDDLSVTFSVNGDDIPMDFVLAVDNDRQLIRLMSPMPYKISEEKRIEGALVTCYATYRMADGSFDYNIEDGSISFRLTASFRESLIGEGLFQRLISLACSAVDAYNDKFLAVNKGMLSVDDFMAG